MRFNHEFRLQTARKEGKRHSDKKEAKISLPFDFAYTEQEIFIVSAAVPLNFHIFDYVKYVRALAMHANHVVSTTLFTF